MAPSQPAETASRASGADKYNPHSEAASVAPTEKTEAANRASANDKHTCSTGVASVAPTETPEATSRATAKDPATQNPSSGVVRPQDAKAAHAGSRLEQLRRSMWGGSPVSEPAKPGKAVDASLAGVGKASPMEGSKGMGANGAPVAAGLQKANGMANGDSKGGRSVNSLLRKVDWLQQGLPEKKASVHNPPALHSEPVDAVK